MKRLFCAAALGWLLISGSASSSLAAPPAGLRLQRIDVPDHRGRTWQLDDFQDASLVAVAFLGTECPLAKLYAARLAEMHRQFQHRGVAFVGVMSNRQDSLAEIASFVRRHQLPFPVLKDAGNRFADQLGAERTPEVFLFDAQRELVYWGRIDDQYGIGYARDQPQRDDLRMAIEQQLDDRAVSVPQTRSVGCIIGRAKAPQPDTAGVSVTYSNQVARILQKRCVECHREGEIAPFAMTDYDEVVGWADMILEVVQEGRMPPWHADPSHGTFANDRSMSDQEKQILRAWVDAGAPEGDPHELPEPLSFLTGWQLPRQPDLVVPISPEPFPVPATGAVKYQYFRVDPKLDHDVWLQAAELQPGNRQVVHHILCFARPKSSQGRDGLGGGARGFLVGYVPGSRVEPFPSGMAKRIPANSELVFQVHYTPIGTPQTDHSRLGLVFADPASITHEVITSSAVQPKLNIPPGDPAHVVQAVTPEKLPASLLLGMSPHMHLRGKAFRYELLTPAGQREVLLDIPAYDFNWQTTYALQTPKALPAGSRIACRAVFDNSEQNLNNPDPSKTVHWGDQTWNEMMIGYFHYAVPVAHAADDHDPRPESDPQTAAQLRIFDRLDSDGDHRLARDETPANLHGDFDRLDADGDAVLTRVEVESGK